jgi:hypothetical protein
MQRVIRCICVKIDLYRDTTRKTHRTISLARQESHEQIKCLELYLFIHRTSFYYCSLGMRGYIKIKKDKVKRKTLSMSKHMVEEWNDLPKTN